MVLRDLNRVLGGPQAGGVAIETTTRMEDRDVHSLLTDLPRERVEGWLDKARRWLGPSWLGQNAGHPLGQLWFRKDWVAATELVSLGFHLERVGTIPSSGKFLREVQGHARSDSASNRTGNLWELVAASMFNNPENPVELAKVNNPGFDFTVRAVEGTSVRFSCKALNPSDNELAFRSLATELEGAIGNIVRPRTTPALLFFRQNDRPAPLSVDICLKAAEQILQQGDDVYGVRGAEGWWIAKRKAAHSTLPLHPIEPSYFVAINSDYPADEQRRFTSMVRKAIENLTKHCAILPPSTTNAAIIKVPSPISMARAEETTKLLFDSTCSHLAGVCLYRSQVVSHGPGKGTFLAHEYRQVANPQASVPFPPMHFHVPIGVYLKTEPKNTMFIGSKAFELENMYMYAGGRLVCRGTTKVTPSGEEFPFTFGRNHMESVTTVFERPGGGTARIDQPSASPWTTLV